MTGDKGYISKDLRKEVAKQGVDLIYKRRKNQLPMSQREENLFKGHRIIEGVFSNLDKYGLSDAIYYPMVFNPYLCFFDLLFDQKTDPSLLPILFPNSDLRNHQ